MTWNSAGVVIGGAEKLITKFQLSSYNSMISGSKSDITRIQMLIMSNRTVDQEREST